MPSPEPTPPQLLPVADTDTLREIWSAFAPDFARHFDPVTAHLATRCHERLDLHNATAVLEVSCGAGGGSVQLAHALGADARLVITDLSPAMVDLAVQRLPDGVEVQVADAEALPFPDNCFDRYTANLSLMLVSDPTRAAAEAKRVLRPGGLAVWSVWGRPENSPMMTLPGKAAQELGIQMPRRIRDNFHLGTPEAARALLGGAGFREVDMVHMPMVMPVPDGATYANLMVDHGGSLRRFLEEQDPGCVEHFRAALARHAQALLDQGKEVALEAQILSARA
jgi:SAM-dependent methyltransferase